MAILKSEDKECPSSLALIAGQKHERYQGQIWQQVELHLVSGSRNISLALPADKETSAANITPGTLLCRTPSDEIVQLVNELVKLHDRQKDLVAFEPSEPSFSLQFTNTHSDGVKVECWIDVDNASSGFYRWDALGVRFYSTREQLNQFINELNLEFIPPATC